MNNLNPEEAMFLADAANAVASQDPERLSELVSDFSEFCFKDPTVRSEGSDFSARFIDGFLALIESPSFLRMDGSFKLLILLQNDWARIDPRFHTRLFEGLERIYPALAD